MAILNLWERPIFSLTFFTFTFSFIASSLQPKRGRHKRSGILRLQAPVDICFPLNGLIKWVALYQVRANWKDEQKELPEVRGVESETRPTVAAGERRIQSALSAGGQTKKRTRLQAFHSFREREKKKNLGNSWSQLSFLKTRLILCSRKIRIYRKTKL